MVLIIGGGIIGLSIAWRLIDIGKKVVVIDKKNLGKEASWAAAGMLSGRLDLKPSEKKLLPLFERSHYAWPKFAKEIEDKSGKNIGYKKEGTLMVACNSNEEKKLKNNYKFLKDNNVNISWFSGDEIRKKEPYVSNNVLSGFFSPEDHHVNNRYILDALITILKKKKNCCVIKENTEVKKIITEKNQVVGVKTKQGTIKTKEIIVCSGAWTNKIKNVEINEAPIRPVKGQMVCLKIPKKTSLLKHILWRENVYLVPRDNSDLIIGATEEEMRNMVGSEGSDRDTFEFEISTSRQDWTIRVEKEDKEYTGITLDPSQSEVLEIVLRPINFEDDFCEMKGIDFLNLLICLLLPHTT